MSHAKRDTWGIVSIVSTLPKCLKKCLTGSPGQACRVNRRHQMGRYWDSFQTENLSCICSLVINMLWLQYYLLKLYYEVIIFYLHLLIVSRLNWSKIPSCWKFSGIYWVWNILFNGLMLNDIERGTHWAMCIYTSTCNYFPYIIIPLWQRKFIQWHCVKWLYKYS